MTSIRLALAGAAMTTAAALVSCSNTTTGTPVCPGCGTQAEPEARSGAAPPPMIVVPPQLPRANPDDEVAPPGQTLPANGQGYVFVQTKSGRTRCQLNSSAVGCESDFQNSPVVEGIPANSVRVTADGSLQWVVGNLGEIPAVTLDYATYSAAGWTIAADPSGTRFTNEATGHGMLVATEGVHSF